MSRRSRLARVIPAPTARLVLLLVAGLLLGQSLSGALAAAPTPTPTPGAPGPTSRVGGSVAGPTPTAAETGGGLQLGPTPTAGGGLPLGLAATATVPAQTGVVGTAYTSPSYGFTLDWAAPWAVVSQSSRAGTDQLVLTDGTVLLELDAGIQAGLDLATCPDVASAAVARNVGLTGLAPALGTNGQPLRSTDPTRPAAVYTATLASAIAPVGAAGTTVAVYVECRQLPAANAVLVAVAFVAADRYNAALPALQALLARVALPGAATGDLLAGVQTFHYRGAVHDTGRVAYKEVPPAGGPHNPVWQNCGFYDTPIASEHAVHSLEHGAVWITYRPDLPADQIAALQRLAEGQTYVLVSPFPNLPAPVIVSSWNHQLRLTGADDPRLARFITAYKQGPDTPEPGATCAGGTSSPSF